MLIRQTHVKLTLVAFFVGAISLHSAFANTVVAIGTGTPPSTLGGYQMTEFGPTGGNFATLSSISSPLGTLSFSQTVEQLTVPSGWNNWSNGYTGDVFYSESSSSYTINLPAQTGAFDFYMENNNYATVTMTATDSSGATISESITSPYGAYGIGFYAAPGSTLSAITITDNGGGDFAAGEFGIAQASAGVPDQGNTLVLLATALTAVGFIAWGQRKLA